MYYWPCSWTQQASCCQLGTLSPTTYSTVVGTLANFLVGITVMKCTSVWFTADRMTFSVHLRLERVKLPSTLGSLPQGYTTCTVHSLDSMHQWTLFTPVCPLPSALFSPLPSLTPSHSHTLTPSSAWCSAPGSWSEGCCWWAHQLSLCPAPPGQPAWLPWNISWQHMITDHKR